MKSKSAPSKTVRRQQLQDTLSLKKSSLFVAVASLLGSHAATAGPEGGEIVNGIGSIVQTDPSSTLITQASERLGIDWQSFNVAEHESVRFDQPNSSSIALNKIFDQNPSQILGALDANGHVFLLNPNGMVFGEGAQINVAGLVATSLDLSQEDFAAGRFDFAGSDSAGLIVNRGLIQAATGGSVTLVGGSVANEGVIMAELGQVNLGAGTRASLDFTGDGLLFFEVSGALLTNSTGADAAVSNTGTIQANGGSVLLTAAAARGVFSSVVNNQGLVRASRIENSGGVIRLVGDGGDVLTSGTLDASGQGGAGGTVQVLGDRVALSGAAVVDVSGDTGGGSAQIGGSFQGSDPNVKNAEATFVGAGTRIDASAGDAGDGGEVIVWADGVTRFNGEIAARGGATSGDGGFVEVSGKETLLYRGQVDARAPNGAIGTLLLDPDSITIQGGEDVAGPDATAIDFDDDLGSDPYTVSEEALEEALATVVLNATDSITATETDTFTYDPDETQGVGVVLLQNNVSLEMRTRNGDGEGGDGPGGIDIGGDTALPNNAPLTFQTQGSGTITLEAGDPDTADQSASLVAGNLVTAGGSITLSALENVTVNNVNAGTGTVRIEIGTDSGNDWTLRIGGIVDGDPENSQLVGGSAESSGHTLIAGAGNDAFVLDAASEGTLNDISFQNFASVDGGGGNDDIQLVTADFAGDVSGGDGDDTFAINVSQTGVFDGGEGSDTFTVGAGVALSSAGVAVTGGADATGNDSDTLNVAANGAALTVSLESSVAGLGFSGTAATVFTGLDGSFAAIDTLVGSADTLQGRTVTSTWSETTYNDGTDTLTFSGIVTAEGRAEGLNTDTLQGGDAIDDLFTVAVAAPPGSVDLNNQNFVGIDALSGLGGDDDFDLNASFGGPINGDGGVDEFFVNATQAGVLNGGLGDDDFRLAVGVSANVLGDAGSDELFGATGQTIFTVAGPDAGTAQNGGGTVNFTSIENLTGNTGDDDFQLNAGLSGTAAGGGGVDEFFVNATQAGVLDGGAGDDDFRLAAGVSAANVQGGADSDEVLGATGQTIFTVAGPDAGTAQNGGGTVNFTSIENLTGNTGDDDFQLNAGLSGTAAGGGGVDEFFVNATQAGVLDGGAGDDDFRLAAGVSAANLQGGADSDEVLGATGQTIFTVAGPDAGTAQNGGGTVNFASIENLTGNTGDDDFQLNAGLSGTAAGGGGVDEFFVNVDQAAILNGGLGDDDFRLAVGVSANVQGDAGSDELFGATGQTIFTVAGPDAGTAQNGGGTVNFTSIENLTGNTGDDDFQLNAGLSGTAAGGGGVDEFFVNATQAGVLDGGAGDDDFRLAAGVSAANVQGGADSDEVLGATGQTIFTVAGPDAGTAQNGGGTVNFTSIENLTGNTGDDDFQLNAGLSGTAAGGGGVDEFFVNATQAGVLNGGLGDDDFRLAVGVSANVLGDAGSDELFGATGQTIFTVAGPDAGTAQNGGGTVNFTSIENLTGNTGDDDFQLNAGLSGTAAGGGGVDEFFVNATQAGVLDGGAGDDDFRLAAGVSAANVQGGADSDEVLGATGQTIFTVAGPDAGTAQNGGGTVNFTSIENLTGNTGDDDFQLNAGLSGTAAGGGGVDEFFVNATQAGVLDGGAGDDIFDLNFSVSGTVSGNDGNDTFAIDASQAGVFDGGEGSDTFTVGPGVALSSAGVAVTGGVDATGNDSDTLNVAANGAALTVSLDDSVANEGFSGTEATVFTGLGGSFAAIDSLVGSANDRLQGRAVTSTWTHTTYNDGAATLAFSGFGTAEGRAAADTLQGCGCDDEFTVAAAAPAGSVDLDGQAFEGIDALFGLGGNDDFDLNADFGGDIDGGDGTDEFLVNAAQTGTLDGGAGDDDFRLSAAVSANFLGGGGSDEIVASTSDTTFVLTAADQGTTHAGAVTFASVENLTGNTGNDDFNLDFNLTGTAAGGAGDDRFDLAAGITATVAGNAGTDSLFAAQTATAFNLAAAGSGSLTNQAATVQFSTIENLTGGAGNDTFAINASPTGVLDGGEGSDAFTIAAAVTLPGAGVRLTGGADAAGNDTDTLNLANAGISTVSLASSVANEGFSGTEAGVFTGGGSFAAIDSLVGSANDRLQGRTVASTWTQATYSDGTEALAFSGFGTAEGRAAADALQGAAGADVFTVAAAGGVDLNGQGFAGIDALDGGAGDDDFRLGAAVSANVQGGAGSDEVIASASATAFALTAQDAGTAQNGGGTVTFASVESLTGNTGNDTFDLNFNLSGTAAGAAGDDAFAIDANQTGVLDGGTGDDDFTLSAGVSADDVQGGGGSDELIGAATATTFELTAQDQGTAQNGGGTVTFASVENLTGNAGNDDFDLDFNLSGTASGAAGNDRFDLAAGISASVAGGAGTDSLFGAPTATTFTVAGANSGSLTNGAGAVQFGTLENLHGGPAADTFVLDDGSHDGNLELVGNAGADTADVRGSFTVTGNLTLNGIETITDNSGGTTLAAGTLNIFGATTVGESGKALVTRIQNLLLESNGNVFLTEKDGLTILALDAGSGRFHITVENGDLRIGLLEADGEGRLDVLNGSIFDNNGADVNMVVSTAVLRTPAGSIGTSEQKVGINVPAGAFIDVASSSDLEGVFISPSLDARLRLGARVFDASVLNTAIRQTREQATNNTLLVDISGVDWASLDPTVALLDCLEPCVRLPADQSEDEELAELREATKLLLIRTSHGWKMIPVVAVAETAALR